MTPARIISLFALLSLSAFAAEYRGSELIGYDHFSEFSKNGKAFLSPIIKPDLNWNELVLSWNYAGAPEDGITLETKIVYPDHETAWYCLGKWAAKPGRYPRESVKKQKDNDARVDTDTLIATRPGGSLQVRVTFEDGAKIESLKFLGLSLCDTTANPEQSPPNKAAWGKSLTVKERSQANYPEGISSWCSPTSTSMILSFWSTNLNRLELDYDVPDVAAAVNDPNWPGTGNWPFNTAFAGSHPGIRAYITRLSDVSELEEWIVSGSPVAVSVSYGLLKGREEKGNGHLVVCTGFTPEGDIIVNDPGRSHVHQIYTRANLIRAWAESHNTVYLIYPENWKVPSDRFHHWHAPRSK